MTASDVYSFAIVLWEMLTGLRPWTVDKHGQPFSFLEVQVMRAVADRGERPPLRDAAGVGSPFLRELVRRSWAHDAASRPSFAQLLDELEGERRCNRPLDVYVSFVAAETASEADDLRRTLEGQGLRVLMTPTASGQTSAGADAAAPAPDAGRSRSLAELSSAKLVVLLTSPHYGRDDTTQTEFNHTLDEAAASVKRFFLIRSGERWDDPRVRGRLGGRFLWVQWDAGTERPRGLVMQLMSRMAGLSAAEPNVSILSSEPSVRGRSHHVSSQNPRSPRSRNRRAIGDAERPWDIFISLRFAEAATEAWELQAALQRRYGLKVFISNVLPGTNLMDLVYGALIQVKLVVIMASRTYGRKTASGFSTYEEFLYTMDEGKPPSLFSVSFVRVLLTP